MNNTTTPNHPADHPVFANMPNTQAMLRGPLHQQPQPSLTIEVEAHEVEETGATFVCTEAKAVAAGVYFSRYDQRSAGTPFSTLGVHDVQSYEVEDLPGLVNDNKITTIVVRMINGEDVRITLFAPQA